MIFVESGGFTDRVNTFLDDETYRAFQNELLGHPEKGVVIPGCGGIRKARVQQPRRNKGKRGGCRIVYLYIREEDRIDLLAIYGKDEQDDLTSQQKAVLKLLAERARHEAQTRRKS